MIPPLNFIAVGRSWQMLNCLHLIVNTSKSEVVHFNFAGENVPVFDVGSATLHHKDSFRYLGMVFYRTLNMAKSAEHAARPFLASAYV